MKRVLIIGATSGIGLELAKLYIDKGCMVGLAGRRKDRLKELKLKYPLIYTQSIDVTSPVAPTLIEKLIDEMGGVDVFIQCAGVGYQNPELDTSLELQTVQTNCFGFMQSVLSAYHYFRDKKEGHIVVVSSIAGTKGLGIAPAYSATKRMQNIYIDALEQQSRIEKSNVSFTDVKPGFIETELLDTEKHSYPLIMPLNLASKKIFRAIEKKKRRPIIDWKFAVLVFFWKLIPSWLWKQLPVKTKSK